MAILTGIAKVRLAASVIPTVLARPPVMILPKELSTKPLFFISIPIIVNSSFSLGLIMPSIKFFWKLFLSSSAMPTTEVYFILEVLSVSLPLPLLFQLNCLFGRAGKKKFYFSAAFPKKSLVNRQIISNVSGANRG